MKRLYTSCLALGSIVLPLSLGTLACGDEGVPPPPGERIQSELERDLTPDVTDAETATLVAGNTEFAIDAYHELAAADGNVFYSPLSVSTALAMTYGGARGTTETQMAAALHYDLPQDTLHPAFNWLDLELQSRGEGAQGADGQPFRLVITNQTFGQKGFEFLPAYLDLLAVDYGAGMSLLDFMRDPEGSRRDINEWIAAVTEDRIPELLPPGIIDTGTRLVLTNAVYFNAAWKTPFEPDLTSTGTFHAPGGDVSVDMMNGQPENLGYVAGNGYEALSLPYDGDELDMIFIVPEAGNFDAFEDSLDAATLATIFDSVGPGEYGALAMPKFEFRFKADMVPVFKSLGMIDPFENADFSGIDGTRSLAITGIVHEAFVAVNEAGTEAAAATGVVVGETSAPQTYTLDRPFLFAIRDVATGSVIFLGRVLDPSQQ